MNAIALQLDDTDAPVPGHESCAALDAATQACQRIAPLWPLAHFVAVNPFLGLTDRSFTEAAGLMAGTAGARMTMPRAFYREAVAHGRIGEQDLALALRRLPRNSPAPRDLPSLHRALQDAPLAEPAPWASALDAASQTTGRDWAGLACERIATWAAGYFDQGQALWPSPSRHLGPYASWRQEAMVDRTPGIMGLAGFRRIVGALPATAEAMIQAGAARLQLDAAGLANYFHRLLMSIGGWAGYARYLGWQSALQQRGDSTLLQLLAVRLAWEVAILEVFAARPAVAEAWAQARERYGDAPAESAERALDALLQDAYEIGWQRQFGARLAGVPSARPANRPAVQAAFCIDVRSEVFRRALEGVADEVETFGVAGFFGMPIEYVPLGRSRGGAQCPVLIAPTITVRQSVRGASPQQARTIASLRRVRLRIGSAWRWFKLAAVSSFSYVESMGWLYAGKLAAHAFGFGRPEPQPGTRGLAADVLARLAPDITPQSIDGHASGIDLPTRVQLAEGALRAMSLRQDFARLVLLVGHGASSANNPHASGLDCGACGGHPGQANARIAAAVLNDPPVREALAGRGIAIPSDTWFLAALHDTTTDRVTVFDAEQLPASHAAELGRLNEWLAAAGARTRLERTAALGLPRTPTAAAALAARGTDWSQVRPELGLAGCAAYVIAPRSRTRGLDLGGRAFLNSYDWRQDEGFAVLESIMTAPMVVGAWINLQYYGSVVDNRVFGCGNKVLHNVVGRLGVLEGNGGDLRSGLPWQSLHDGKRLLHEPLRLSVVIDAPLEAINTIIARHEPVRQLVDQGWIHLFAMGEGHGPLQRYRGRLQWEPTP
ncbi:YbcC family protein [Frateuria sp. GZRR33]|uniref:YbcC family protein n=1 Tax=Frateuria sp. GZRR33 TaxID=3351535 RepID=UPI003EDBF607